jgi:two-component system, NarL family, response regulator
MTSQPLRVLAADDQPCFLEALAAFLAGEERLTLVGCAHDGAEAVALAESLGPDVVLMDLDMPRMDGVEATRRIRATSSPPEVVVVTGSDLAVDVDRACRAGAAAYITKDRVWTELVRSLFAALDRPGNDRCKFPAGAASF